MLPRLPERPRLLRLCTTPHDRTRAFWAAPPGLRGRATEGLEWSHPLRAGRRPHPIGRTGLSQHRWLVGGTLGLRLNPYGEVGAWAWDPATVAENPWQWLRRQWAGRLRVRRATGCHAAAGAAANLQRWQRGEGEERLLVETGLSRLTGGCHCQRVMPRVWAYVQARLACTMAAFPVLVPWHGGQPDASGFVPLSMAEYSL